MKVLDRIVNYVEVCDSISEELYKLNLVYTFLSQISDVSHEEGVQYIGRWNVKYFNSAMATLGETIENIEEIISD
jgi:hypothetical protein